jgi:hypothetical protein
MAFVGLPYLYLQDWGNSDYNSFLSIELPDPALPAIPTAPPLDLRTNVPFLDSSEIAAFFDTKDTSLHFSGWLSFVYCAPAETFGICTK